MQQPFAFVGGLDGLFRNVDQVPIAQCLSVHRDEVLGLLGGKKIEVVLAHQVLARQAEQLLANEIEADESEVFGVLDENHVRDVFDHRVEELVCRTELSGSLLHLRFQLGCGHLLVAHELRGEDRPRRPRGEALEKLEVAVSERGGALHPIEVESPDDPALSDHRDHRGFTYPPLLNVPHLMRGNVRG